ncbi:hypothetical protein [Bacillus piscicola]|uniref:hypothetical protein n=1 Tax=Bacillus piscicola TaxID=1632684 RepID=UPI001F094FA2|nr:hypothetical protein [Bacillus piscicola]
MRIKGYWDKKMFFCHDPNGCLPSVRIIWQESQLLVPSKDFTFRGHSLGVGYSFATDVLADDACY